VALSAAVLRRLEAKMALDPNWVREEYLKRKEEAWVGLGEERGEAKGKAEGKAEALLDVLAARGLAVSDAQRQRALACTDLDTLARWLRRAATASSCDEVFGTDA